MPIFPLETLLIHKVCFGSLHEFSSKVIQPYRCFKCSDGIDIVVLKIHACSKNNPNQPKYENYIPLTHFHSTLNTILLNNTQFLLQTILEKKETSDFV